MKFRVLLFILIGYVATCVIAVFVLCSLGSPIALWQCVSDLGNWTTAFFWPVLLLAALAQNFSLAFVIIVLLVGSLWFLRVRKKGSSVGKAG